MARTAAKAKVGPKSLTGSAEAKKQAAVLLEVLSGLRGPQEGSEALGVSLNRYYQLETRALQGLIAALEPRPRGRQRTVESELELLRQDKQRLSRELTRNQALLRAAQRSLGLPQARSDAKGRKLAGKHGPAKKGKRRTRTVRARKAIAVLRQAEPAATTERVAAAGTSS